MDPGIGDSEDSSWKVRLASIQILDALIENRPDILQERFKVVFDALLSRTAEPVTEVRLEVFKTLSSLIRSAVILEDNTNTSLSLSRKRSFFVIVESEFPRLIPVLVASCKQDLASKNGALGVLVVVTRVIERLDDFADTLYPLILESLSSDHAETISSSLKIFSRLLETSLMLSQSLVREHDRAISLVLKSCVDVPYEAVRLTAIQSVSDLINSKGGILHH
jgi:hypothetical protein